MSDYSHDIEKNALATRYADLLTEQADAEELQLLNDLEALYTAARVPAQLTLMQAFSDNTNTHTQQPPEHSIAPGTPSAISPKSRVVNLQRRSYTKQKMAGRPGHLSGQDD